MFQINY